MKQLTIEHTHGVLVLSDVTLNPYDCDARMHGGNAFRGHVAVGTVVSGGVTNRLFHCTSYTPFPVGEQMRYDIYGCTPRCVDAEADKWHVSCVSCG